MREDKEMEVGRRGNAVYLSSGYKSPSDGQVLVADYFLKHFFVCRFILSRKVFWSQIHGDRARRIGRRSFLSNWRPADVGPRPA